MECAVRVVWLIIPHCLGPLMGRYIYKACHPKISLVPCGVVLRIYMEMEYAENKKKKDMYNKIYGVLPCKHTVDVSHSTHILRTRSRRVIESEFCTVAAD